MLVITYCLLILGSSLECLEEKELKNTLCEIHMYKVQQNVQEDQNLIDSFEGASLFPIIIAFSTSK